MYILQLRKVWGRNTGRHARSRTISGPALAMVSWSPEIRRGNAGYIQGKTKPPKDIALSGIHAWVICGQSFLVCAFYWCAFNCCVLQCPELWVLCILFVKWFDKFTILSGVLLEMETLFVLDLLSVQNGVCCFLCVTFTVAVFLGICLIGWWRISVCSVRE